MTYQYRREPLSIEEDDRLLNAGSAINSRHHRLSTIEICLNMSPQQVLEEFQRKW